MDHLQNELKREFQIERMILFSDAIFAIAITLLVIELKIPEIPKQLVTEDKLIDGLTNLIPKFVGFLISFCVIGLFWIIHHRMFGFVVNYNRKLLVLNLFFLFGVVLMHFSTSFYSEYVLRLLKSPVIVYVSNICFLGITNIMLWLYISNPKNKLSAGIHPLLARYILMRSVTMPAIFLVMALVYTLVQPILALWILPFVGLIIRTASAGARKKLRNLEATQKNLPGKSMN